MSFAVYVLAKHWNRTDESFCERNYYSYVLDLDGTLVGADCDGGARMSRPIGQTADWVSPSVNVRGPQLCSWQLQA
jgi:hypothetical protein